MARRPRSQLAGSVQHVTARGAARGAIVHDDGDRRHFVDVLADTTRTTGWTCMAFCLLTNHYHLLLEVDVPRLSVGMHLLQTAHAVRFNRRHGRAGHVFDARFHATPVEDSEHGEEVVRYIALNPVRAGLCQQPEDWRWSSYRAVAGLESAPPGVTPDASLRWFDGDRAALVASVRAARDRPARPPLAELLHGDDRDGILRARRLYGYAQKEIAAFLGVSQPTISRRIRGQ